MKKGDKVRLKEGIYVEASNNPLNIDGVISEDIKDGDYIFKVNWDNGEWNTYKRSDLYLVDEPMKSIRQQVEERYLGKYVFQGYCTGELITNRFMSVNEVSNYNNMFYNSDTDYAGVLHERQTFTAITVEDYIRGKYKAGQTVKCLGDGSKVTIYSNYTVSIGHETQTVLISTEGRLVCVYNNGRFSEPYMKESISSSGILNLDNEPVPIVDIKWSTNIPDFVTTTVRPDIPSYAHAVTDEPSVIKTKKSKSLDVNIKSSKFVIPKIK